MCFETVFVWRSFVSQTNGILKHAATNDRKIRKVQVFEMFLWVYKRKNIHLPKHAVYDDY